jgi:hypothetical protein
MNYEGLLATQEGLCSIEYIGWMVGLLNRGIGWYPIGGDHIVEEIGDEKSFYLPGGEG